MDRGLQVVERKSTYCARNRCVSLLRIMCKSNADTFFRRSPPRKKAPAPRRRTPPPPKSPSPEPVDIQAMIAQDREAEDTSSDEETSLKLARALVATQAVPKSRRSGSPDPLLWGEGTKSLVLVSARLSSPDSIHNLQRHRWTPLCSAPFAPISFPKSRPRLSPISSLTCWTSPTSSTSRPLEIPKASDCQSLRRQRYVDCTKKRGPSFLMG